MSKLTHRVSHGSQEEFAVRLYRRQNQVSSRLRTPRNPQRDPQLTPQSGFCKAFSDEPEMFAHGLSPLKDMLVNLNMNNVMVWPR
jgi:DNA excision repair protein ERCC-4